MKEPHDQSAGPTTPLQIKTAGGESIDTSNGKRWLRHRRLYYIGILSLAVLTILLITLLVDRPTDVEDYVHQSGYLGVFLMGLIGSASPVWPLPGSWATFIAAGLGLNPGLLGLACGMGEPIGETTAYMAGFGGQVAVINLRGYGRVERWMKRHGAITLFLVSAIPNVLTKVAVISSGALKYPFWKFFLLCWTGKTIKSLFFAITGYYFFEATHDLFERFF